MLWFQVLSLLTAFGHQSQAQCAPTTTVVVPAGVSATISAETYAQVQSLGSVSLIVNLDAHSCRPWFWNVVRHT